MPTSVKDSVAVKVWFTDDDIWVKLDDGRQIGVPIRPYCQPRRSSESPSKSPAVDVGYIGTISTRISRYKALFWTSQIGPTNTDVSLTAFLRTMLGYAHLRCIQSADSESGKGALYCSSKTNCSPCLRFNTSSFVLDNAH